MKSVDRLLREHRAIEDLLSIVEATARRLDAGGEVPIDMIEQLLDLLQRTTDEMHHAKEEGLFFPSLTRNGLDPEASPVERLTADHETGREHVRAMRRAIAGWNGTDAPPRRTLTARANAYVTLLREHIALEDSCFEALATRFLSDDDDRELLAAFEAIDEQGGEPGQDAALATFRATVATW